ncbi:N-acetylmuramoyl-L-alanine amidase [Prevotella sp. A2931]|uniref:N-acetylmuramoyl-L-alanine amidase n=1 Tax=Prevotella illustrans TaxID=2800387 RepID=A0ABS3M4Q0_9BACT|nr:MULTISPECIES: N-acetylmuramoyl-L-alanine amidase [Prevotella]MBO1363148.1 N-acetylmuramoyl-L-alanine amidase [Prevotella illustrans]PTL26026.1 N-acetylmuramoyl-L-alanine amidase [Prevotella sp. oral taxon 820]
MIGKKVFLFTLILLFVTLSVSADKKFVLVIDAGHGGVDNGAMGAFSKEKDINLNIALEFGRYVEQNSPDVKVVYTRKTDVKIALNERANIANRANADLFISVHTNSLPAGRVARGFQTYTLGMHRAKDNLDVAIRENSVISLEKNYKQTYAGFDPKSSESYIMFEFIQGKNMEKSVELARDIQNSVCKEAGRIDKGVHQAGFLVLRETSMPSCLIELGFITSSEEETFLNSPEGIRKMGQAIYHGFLRYKNRYFNGIVVPYKAETAETAEIPQLIKDNDGNRGVGKDRDSSSANKPSAQVVEAKPARQVIKEEPQTVSTDQAKPIFKIQILVTSRKLRPGDGHFKQLEPVECFEENGMNKYTYGASDNYNEIHQLRKQILDKFPEAFIIAFKNGEKISVNSAIQEFKKSR